MERLNKTWNQPEITQWEQANAPTERSFRKRLGDKAPVGWEVRERQGDKFARHDCVLVALNLEDLFGSWRIELECGRTQTDWDDVLLPPWRWPRGLDMLARKHYQNLVFIRYSPTYRSAYAVDDAWFREAIVTGEVGPAVHDRKNKTQEAFGGGEVDQTCNDFYAITWDVVRRRRGDTIFIMEHEDWRGLWGFLVRLTGLNI